MYVFGKSILFLKLLDKSETGKEVFFIYYLVVNFRDKIITTCTILINKLIHLNEQYNYKYLINLERWRSSYTLKIKGVSNAFLLFDFSLHIYIGKSSVTQFILSIKFNLFYIDNICACLPENPKFPMFILYIF